MLKHKQKKWRQTRLFIFGILIGSMVGISIFWWITYFRNSDWIFTSKINHWIESLFSSSAEPESGKEEVFKIEKESKSSKKNIDEDTINYGDYSDEFFYDDAEPLVFIDSINEYSTENANESSNNDVKKDELLDVREVVFNSDKDLLLDSLIGINKGQEAVSITVEFWRSPINFKGYKRSPKKIIIFGAKNPEKVEFKMKDGKLIMTDEKSKYILRYTNIYLKLEPIHSK